MSDKDNFSFRNVRDTHVSHGYRVNTGLPILCARVYTGDWAVRFGEAKEVMFTDQEFRRVFHPISVDAVQLLEAPVPLELDPPGPPPPPTPEMLQPTKLIEGEEGIRSADR